MDIIYTVFFVIIASVLVLSALAVVLARSIVHASVALILTFLAVAGIFIMLNADFVGIAQMIVYAVGITIVLLFAIMLTSKKEDEKLWIAKAPRTLFALMIAGSLFIVISYAITNGFTQLSENTGIFKVKKPAAESVEIIKREGTAGIIGKSLFTKYVLPFEILSLLLLAVILGTVVIARKDKDKLINPTTNNEES